MIEMIITIAVLSFGVLAIYELFFPIVNYTHTVTQRFVASNLAQEGLEIVRNIRDNNFIATASDSSVRWDRGLLECSTGCQLDYKTGTAQQSHANNLAAYDPDTFLSVNQDGLYGYDAGTTTPFTRDVVIQQISSDVLKVTSTVYWSYNGQQYSFATDEYLYNWY